VKLSIGAGLAEFAVLRLQEGDHHGRAVVHVVSVVVGMSAKVDDSRGAGERPLLNRPVSQSAGVVLGVEGGHVEERVRSYPLEKWAADISLLPMS